MRTSPSSRSAAVLSLLIVGLFVASAVTAIGADRLGTAPTVASRASESSGVSPLVTTPFNLTINPNIFSTYYASNGTGIAPTVVTTNGGTFGAGFTVYFCVSTTDTFNGPPSDQVGSIVLNGGQTTLSNTPVTFADARSTVLDAAGKYYIAATDSVGGCGGASSSYTNGTKITTTTVAPTVAFTSPDTVGATDPVTGSLWDANATVTLHLNNLTGATLATLQANASGYLVSPSSFVVPVLPYTPAGYLVEAQETAPTTGALYKITSERPFQIESSITVTPFYFNGMAGKTLNVTGTGFAAGATIATNSTTVGGKATKQLAVTTTNSGGFNVTATLLASISPTPGGFQSIGITTTPASSRATFPNSVFVTSPSPGSLQFALSTTSVHYGTSVTARAWNFPAGATVTFDLGSTVLGTEVASSLGYAQLVTTIPATPAGAYDAYATDAAGALFSPTVAVTVTPLYAARDLVGFTLPATAPTEYVPSLGLMTVLAYGLSPISAMPFTDSAWAGVVAADSIGLAQSAGYDHIYMTVGSLNASTGSFLSAPNGTLIFSYLPDYGRLPSVATGTTELIGNATTPFAAYATIGTPNLSTIVPYSSYQSGTVATITVSNLIPRAAHVYETLTTHYTVALGATELSGLTGSTCGTVQTSVCYGVGTPSATMTFKFLVPAVMGVIPLAIRANGTETGLASVPVVISSPGAAPGDGAIFAVTNPVSQNVEVTGVGLFPSAANYTLYVSNLSTAAGVDSKITPVVNVAGALVSVDISSPVAYTSEPAGTYAIYLFFNNATLSASLSTTYLVDLGHLALSPGSGSMGTSVTVSTSGLSPGSYYDVYLGSTLWMANVSSANGSFSAESAVPMVAAGTYTVSLDPTGSSAPVETSTFTVTGTVSLVTAGTDQIYAFPGELVDFAWNVTGHAPPSAFPFTVTVLLNGSAYSSVTGVLSGAFINGSFTMPNACPGSETSCSGGSYWWVTFNWTQVESGYGTVAGYTDPDPAYLQLVNGNGALVLSITPTDIAEIATLTGADVNVTLQALDAKISGVWASGNTTYAQLATDFGDMNVTLADLSAKVSGVWASGNTTYVQLKTDFGDVNVTLAALSGKVSSVWASGNTTYVQLKTDFGDVNVTLAALSGKISDVWASGNTTYVQLKTDFGDLNVTLAALSAKISDVWASGNTTYVQLKTDFGDLNVTLAAISTAVTSVENGNAKVLTSLGNVTVSLKSINATVNSIEATSLTLSTSLGDVRVTLNDVNANLTTVKNDVLEMTTAVGQLNLTVASLNATLSVVNDTEFTISTNLGKVQASLTSLGTTVTAISTNTSSLLGSMVIVKTDLGTLSGTVDMINGNVTTVETGIGQLKMSTAEIQSAQGSQPSTTDLNGVADLVYVAIALSAITLLLALLLFFGWSRRRGGSL
jgi:hypothetical protein